jgi:hypothetical protein
VREGGGWGRWYGCGGYLIGTDGVVVVRAAAACRAVCCGGGSSYLHTWLSKVSADMRCLRCGQGVLQSVGAWGGGVEATVGVAGPVRLCGSGCVVMWMCVRDRNRLALGRAVVDECSLQGRQVCRCVHTLSVGMGCRDDVCTCVGVPGRVSVGCQGVSSVRAVGSHGAVCLT